MIRAFWARADVQEHQLLGAWHICKSAVPIWRYALRGYAYEVLA